MKDYIIKLDKPASRWDLTYPVGNGRIGGSISGDPLNEKIYINEESIWSSSGLKDTSEGFYDKMLHARELIMNGELDKTDEYMNKAMVSFNTVKSYEYAGILNVKFTPSLKIKNYIRSLDLVNGVAKCEYQKEKTNYLTELFAPVKENILVYRVRSDKKSSYSFEFTRENIKLVKVTNEMIVADCSTAFGDHRFTVSVKIVTDGEKTAEGGVISINNAETTVVYISVITAFRTAEFHSESLALVNYSLSDCEKIIEEHKKEFYGIMTHSDLSINSDKNLEDRPMSKRLKRLKKSSFSKDYGLINIYWQFGKYLLVSSSRNGCLPANLQGIWVEGIENPWNSDFHTNINLQMNYWQAEAAGLSDFTQPLFDFMNKYLLESGKKTAADYYHIDGTVVHHLSDIYGFTCPADGVWGIWPMGGAWLCYHMWEHYLYTDDVDFLRNDAYEYIKQSALFFMNYMFEGKDGKLLTGPSTSPENSFIFKHKPVSLTVSPAMDTEIITGLLGFYIECENILDIDSELKQRAENTLSKMQTLKIGKYGQLMEWIEDYKEAEKGHRHISHAFALYPGGMITRQTPDLYNAIKVTIDRRLRAGGGHTGWSRAWLINLFARLRSGKDAYKNLRKLFTKSTIDNLFDMHPPFQIDGNFGGAAGITEMLLQSHEGFISLLPAVPMDFSGKFDNLVARGNVRVSCEFEKGEVISFLLESFCDKTVKVELPEYQTGVLSCDTGENIIKNEDGLYCVNIEADKRNKFNVKN
ncbi:MAG: glycoside hydrolase family 95 protein [Clostridiales bacterium]|nr:glycoside hydrolase family 95 protein [Clostridiales bacterium]